MVRTLLITAAGLLSQLSAPPQPAVAPGAEMRRCYRLMVRPHPGSSGLGRASRFTSRGPTPGCALTVLVCSVGSSAAAFS
jgi:hypothetical protein